MRFFRLLIVSFFSISLAAQNKTEIVEFSGKVTSIEPGPNFALSRIIMEVTGEPEAFSFYPTYGKLIFEKIKIGDDITLKANVNLRARETYKKLSKTNKDFSWWMARDPIIGVKIDNQWIEIKEPEMKPLPEVRKIFLDKKVVGKYNLRGLDKGLLFENGLVGFNYWLNSFFNETKNIKKDELVSFFGHKLKYQEGYKYPLDGVGEVYWLGLLNKETAQLKSFLYKQNNACIGVKFQAQSGNELKLSFPSEYAQRVRDFLKPEQDLRVYFGPDYKITKLDLPELHAIIQDKDTLFIEDFGFFGDADGKHDHVDVELKGKITRINKSDRGNVMSIIVGSEYYVEIDAMMAQQLGLFFKKGKEVAVAGKERVKKRGEIYSKDYKIVSPEKIAIDGKTFELYHP